MQSVTGECFCGEIKYEIQGPLPPGRSCHCSRCRKAFSGAGSAMTMLAPNSFRWLQGEELINRYINKAGIGLGFCKTCGTTLCAFNQGEVMGITLGCLNDDPDVEIADHIFVGSKACWDKIGGKVPQHETWPQETESGRDRDS